MTPLPKRRHSTRRSGKRERISLAVNLPQFSRCPKCNKKKLAHRVCASCGFYK